jgi:hypothetical protein
MKLALKTTFSLLTITITIILYGGATDKMNAGKLDLPKTVGVWYRFRHLEVFDYTSPDQGNILVELYFMESPDDAFGLLSLDWGGEPVSFDGTPDATSKKSFTASTRALYGGGLMRLWSDYIYARIMAERETPASKEVVLALGKSIAANTQNPSEPVLVKKELFSIPSGVKFNILPQS